MLGAEPKPPGEPAGPGGVSTWPTGGFSPSSAVDPCNLSACRHAAFLGRARPRRVSCSYKSALHTDTHTRHQTMEIPKFLQDAAGEATSNVFAKAAGEWDTDVMKV